MSGQLLAVGAKALLGGVLVVLFAVGAETLSPKRFAGVFAGAPSVALASLSVTLATKGSAEAAVACAGMAAGAVGFAAYCACSPALMRRLGTLRGSAAALVAWAAATAVLLPVTAAATGTKVLAAAGVGVTARRPPLRAEPGKVKDAAARDWLMRFAFGAATSAVAGIVSILAGPLAGGAFLAFPAILLASLTLVAEEEGRVKARDDARGATAGGLGLLVFALVGHALFGRTAAVLVLALGTAGWAVVAVGSYLAAWRLGAGADEPTG